MGGSNLGAILKTIESKAPPADTEAPPAEPEPPQAAAAEGKKVQINHLIVRDGRIGLSATLLGGSQATIPLPEIHLKDIGKEKDGASVPEVVAQVSRALFGAIGQAVAGSGKLLGKGADLAGDALIGGVKAAGDIADESVKVLGDAAGAAADTAAQAAGKSVDMAADAGKAVAGAGKAVVGGAGKTVTGAGKAVVGGATGAGKAVTGAAADAGKAVGSAVGKTTGKLVGGMKSLLGGRKEPPPADPNEDTEEQGEE
jgi:hypothetical protein